MATSKKGPGATGPVEKQQMCNPTTLQPDGQEPLAPPRSEILSRDRIVHLPPADIRPNPQQPRQDIGNLAVLAASFRQHGVQAPITVLDNGDGTYTLIAGERRLLAARLAKLETIPAIVRTICNPAILALVENLQREDLKPLEEAEAFRKLLDTGYTQESLANELGIGPTRIAQKVRLLSLGSEGRRALNGDSISESTARQLLRLAVFDRVATQKHDVYDSHSEQWTKFVLWKPCYARSRADVQFGVDELLGDLDRCVDEYENLPAVEAEESARKTFDDYVVALRENGPLPGNQKYALMYLQLRPDWAQLRESDRHELVKSRMRWTFEYLGRNPSDDPQRDAQTRNELWTVLQQIEGSPA